MRGRPLLVGRIARIKGCRVVGVAGSDAKTAWLAEVGFDAAFNYKATADDHAALGELRPGGIDVYFDNVGGAVTDAVLRRINTGARIAVCGQISQYNLETPEPGPRWLDQLIAKQAKVHGAALGAVGLRTQARARKQGSPAGRVWQAGLRWSGGRVARSGQAALLRYQVETSPVSAIRMSRPHVESVGMAVLSALVIT